MIRTRKFIVCAFVFLSSIDYAAASTCPAEDYIQSAGQAFMSASRKGSAGAFSAAASRFGDLHALALFALGPYRKDLPKSRETEYVARARTFVGKFMAKYGSKFAGNSIAVTSCNEAAGGLIVGTKLSSGQSLTFRLRKAGGGYRVQDVSVSSIWLAQTMRGKFTGVMRENNGDIDALMSYLGN
jgi:phospholipid transport system substrate-binding protein